MKPPGRTWASPVVFGVALAVGLSSANAQPFEPSGSVTSDYDVRNVDWNGLSELIETLTVEGFNVGVVETVDLSDHPVDRPLAIIYPTTEFPSAELLEFVTDGGQLFIADDFGQSGSLLMELGIYRGVGELPHTSYYQDNPQLPSFRPTGSHPMLDSVARVVANHPAWLGTNEQAVIAYEQPNSGFLVEVPWGDGRIVVLADPSLLINFMLDVADNQTLAVNIFRSLCPQNTPCSVTVTTRAVEIGGDYPLPQPEEEQTFGQRIEDLFQSSFANVNEELAKVAGFRPDRRGVFFASMLLGLGISVFLFSTLPLVKPRWLSFTLRASSRLRSRSEFEWNLERFIEGRKYEDYGLPLSILKEEFEELFLSALAHNPGELDPEKRYDPKQLGRFAARFGKRVWEADSGEYNSRRAAENDALATLKAFARIPRRKDLVPEVDGRYSERLLQKLYKQSIRLLEGLGIREQYEQRTGRP